MQAALKMASARQTFRKIQIEKPQLQAEPDPKSGPDIFCFILLAASYLFSLTALLLVAISSF